MLLLVVPAYRGIVIGCIPSLKDAASLERACKACRGCMDEFLRSKCETWDRRVVDAVWHRALRGPAPAGRSGQAQRRAGACTPHAHVPSDTALVNTSGNAYPFRLWPVVGVAFCQAVDLPNGKRPGLSGCRFLKWLH